MTRMLGLIFLLLAGSVSLAYGLFFHKVTLEETKQREVSVAFSTLSGIEESTPESGGEAQAAEKSPASAGGSVSDEVDPFRTPTADATPAGKSENPFESSPDASSAAGVRYEKVTEDYVDLREEVESVIVREVTFGGVELLANGHLKRTYTGKPPALCPT